ncbi:MAG: chitobiase/beta-hexosaminidase C-terminal domain-containing protein [Bacteroidaceae bacterium]|nr:chitobiase/beta-hexosaminidase C-terminal domain-containing protein [Bacteroidaceae bacterium]
MASSKHTLGILNEYGKSKPRVWLEYGWSMARVWLRYALMMVLMMISGAMNEVWGQDPDYSGTYYIASRGYDGNPNNTNNYYLCPTEGWISYDTNDTWKTGDDNPFLTTYKCKSGAYTSGASNAVWIIEKHPTLNYYYIKHKSDGKYMVSNGKINGTSNANRIRVHLEEVAQADLDDKALFSIKTYSIQANGASPYFVISPKSSAGWNGEYKWYSVNNGNQDALKGKGKDGGPSGYKETGGIVGLYNEIDINAQFFFEDVITRPTITYNNTSNQIEISAAQTGTVTIKYTTDGTTPSADNGETYSAPFTPAEGVTTIKAITIGTDGESNVATFTIKKYLIQSQNNAWNTTDFNFYMIPGDDNKVNTTSLFRSSMEWTFRSASVEKSIQYYYIINNANNKYLCYDATNKVHMEDFGSGGNNFLFYMKESSTYPGTYNIIPYGQTLLITKNNGNNTADIINTSQNNAANAILENTRWKFISALGGVLPSSLTYDSSNSADPNWPAFLSTSSVNPKYLKIENVVAERYLNPPADPSTGFVTATGTGNGNDLVWYIIEADHDNWQKYYYIVHKNTGRYLKFNQEIASPVTSMGDKNKVLSLLEYDASASDRYQFIFAKSTVDGAYYIVPKELEDATYNNYYALYRDGTNPIKSNKNRASDSYKWKFVPFCYNPVFVESEGDITLTCATTGAEIHYTNDGTEPDENSTTYSSTNWSSSNQVRIKAIGVIKEGDVVVSTSEVVTLLNNPDVTLESGPFTYKGTEHKPEVTVTIGSGETITSAPTSPATYTIAYANNINAGENTATVTITDLDANDRWYIWNVPTKTFTIEKKMLTVTADDKTVEYGHPAPEYTVTINGFENGEGRAVLTTIPSATCSTYTTSSAVGSTHVITPGGGVDENYDFTYENGTLTVAAAFVTLTANSGTETYDGTEQTVTGFTCSVDGLTFTGVSASGSGTNAGTYPVTFTGAIANATKDDTNQYVVTEIVNGTLTIDPVAATVTADDKTKTYGEADPALTVTITGMVNGESTDLITYTISRASGDNAGTYTITPTGEAAQGNYTVSYVPGTFTISQKDLTITANNHTIEYSNAPENNGVTYSGFITGEDEDTEGVFTGTLAYSYNSANDGSGTSYTTTIPKGTAYIIPSGLTATNYNITYNYGTLTVTAKSIGNGSSMASGFTLNFGDGGNIILLDGETTLTLTTDYTIGEVETTTSGKYSSKKVSGTGNYTGSFKIRNAIVNFQTDAERVEWSATFVAEPAGTDLADDTKGHKLPEGIRAYIIIDIDGEWAIPEPLDYIPEGIPVLLISDKAAGGFLVEDVSGKTPPASTNMLKEVTASTPGYITDSGDPNYEKVHFDLRSIYLLSYNEFVHNMPGYLAKGKVYLDPTTPTPPPSPAPRRLRIKWDDVTGIEELQNDGNTETRNDAWYTLDGRRIDNSKFKIQNSSRSSGAGGTKLPKGIYITNGRKVIIK